MRITRSQTQWQTIIEEQQASGLTIVDYCRQHELSTTTFYAVRKKLGLKPSSFVRTKVTQQVEVVTQQPGIELSIGQAILTLPASTSASYLGQVLRALT